VFLSGLGCYEEMVTFAHPVIQPQGRNV